MTRKRPLYDIVGVFFLCQNMGKGERYMDFETLLETVCNDERSRKVPILFIIQILGIVDDRFKYIERED